MQPAFRVFALVLVAWTPPFSTLRAEEAERITTFEARGVIQSLDAPGRQATIAHEEIRGYMPAMTMTFEMHDFAALPALVPGDPLTFRLCVTADRAWIDQVRKMSGPDTPPLAPALPSATRELSVGDPLPDSELINQRGETVHLRDFHGQALAITFIYTRCPLPTYCPLMNRNFQVAQNLLVRLEAGENWHLLSVSLDREHDTPPVLTSIAQIYQADPGHWSFASASEGTVRQLGGSVGLAFNVSKNGIDHNLRTVVVDAAGRVRRVFRGNTWTPQELVAEIRSAMPTPH